MPGIRVAAIDDNLDVHSTISVYAVGEIARDHNRDYCAAVVNGFLKLAVIIVVVHYREIRGAIEQAHKLPALGRM